MTADVSSNERDLVTRDFLGSAVIGYKDLDLDLDLNLKIGETCIEKSGPVHRELHDLNLPPPPSDGYESVCTLDKVRSALERAKRGSRSRSRPQTPDGSASPASSLSTSSSARRRADREAGEETNGCDSSTCLVAAGCPGCLMYVLVSRGDPRCPRCDSHVQAPAPVVLKKRRIDLNSM